MPNAPRLPRNPYPAQAALGLGLMVFGIGGLFIRHSYGLNPVHVVTLILAALGGVALIWTFRRAIIKALQMAFKRSAKPHNPKDETEFDYDPDAFDEATRNAGNGQGARQEGGKADAPPKSRTKRQTSGKTKQAKAAPPQTDEDDEEIKRIDYVFKLKDMRKQKKASPDNADEADALLKKYVKSRKGKPKP